MQRNCESVAIKNLDNASLLTIFSFLNLSDKIAFLNSIGNDELQRYFIENELKDILLIEQEQDDDRFAYWLKINDREYLYMSHLEIGPEEGFCISTSISTSIADRKFITLTHDNIKKILADVLILLQSKINFIKNNDLNHINSYISYLQNSINFFTKSIGGYSKTTLNSKTLKELRTIAKEMKIIGYSTMKKDELVKKLSNKNKKIKNIN